MATIGIWNEDTIETVPDLVLIRQSNLNDFLELVQAGELTKPQKIFVVAPNGYLLEDLLMLYVLGRNSDWDIVAIQKSAPELVRRYSVWQNLVLSLTTVNHSTLSAWIEEFSKSASTHQTRVGQVVSLLQSYVRLCLQPLTGFELFRTYSINQSASWWSVNNVYGESLSKFQKEASTGLVEMPALQVLDTAAASAAAPWKSMAGRPTEEKFFELSAFCFGLAKRYLEIKQMQLAFVLAHRALDLYFHYLGLREGVLIEKSNEIGYRTKEDKIYLIELEYELYQAQVLVASKSRKDFLIKVNSIRNQLLLTHGAHHVLEHETINILDGIDNLILTIEASTKWRQRSAIFFPTILKGLSFLFESIPDIHTFVEDRTDMLSTL